MRVQTSLASQHAGTLTINIMRSMIGTNERAFLSLSNAIEGKIDQKIVSCKRFFATDDDEKNWLKKGKIIEQCQLFSNAKAILLECENEIVFVLIGLKTDELSADNPIHTITSNAGIVTLLISEEILTFSDNIEPLKLYENVLYETEKSYTGHDYKEIRQYFESVTFFAIPNDSILKGKPINRILCYVISNTKTALSLCFKDNVIKHIEELSLEGGDELSFEIITDFLISNNYKHAFLELYRLLERRFNYHYLAEFYKATQTSLDFYQFSKDLEKITGWRPKEDDALRKLLNKNGHSDCCISRSGKIDKTIYRIRNQIVHYRTSHTEEYRLNKEQYNKIFDVMLRVIRQEYKDTP